MLNVSEVRGQIKGRVWLWPCLRWQRRVWGLGSEERMALALMGPPPAWFALLGEEGTVHGAL